MLRPHALTVVFAFVLAVQSLYGQVSGWTETIKSTAPAVVTITTNKALGSGFLVDTKGVIATNAHVIAGAKDVAVKMYNGEVYRGADVMFVDPDRDLAIIKIQAVDLPTLRLGNSDRVAVGEDVLLIGAPIGLEDTVSSGIVSGMRLHAGTKVIQTTAAASHGSSGGPLLNRNGEVIGLMTFLVEGGQNLNFAVSINYLRGILDSLPNSAPTRLGALRERTASGAKSAGGIYVYVYRTFNHIQYSSDAVFQAVADAVMLFLKSENVPMVNDNVGRIIETTGRSYSTYELIAATEKSGGTGLLYITVDRPVSAWLKVTARYYDLRGRVLWQEEAQKKSGLSSRGSIERVCQSLETKMLSHLSSFAESQPSDNKSTPPNTVVTDNPR